MRSADRTVRGRCSAVRMTNVIKSHCDSAVVLEEEG
jgi:hypothetical protein